VPVQHLHTFETASCQSGCYANNQSNCTYSRRPSWRSAKNISSQSYLVRFVRLFSNCLILHFVKCAAQA
jgi:hypothetical protein